MPQSPAEALKNLLNIRPHDDPYFTSIRDPLDANTNKDLPSVPPPPMFRPDIPIGSPDVRKAYEDITKIAPELRGRASRIQVGPSGGAAKDLMSSGIPVHQYALTNLMGAYDPSTREISLNPNVANEEEPDHSLHHTLSHELGHAAGYPEGEQIQQIGKAADQTFGPNKAKTEGDIVDQLIEAFKKIGGTKVMVER